MAGLYLHIPYCRQACHYCDFHFSTNLSSKSAMLEAMGKEISFWQKNWQGGPFQSIYFGGGTPSVLEDSELTFLLEKLHHAFDISREAEITLEANPDDFVSEKARFWRDAGINRLSIGIQTFDNNRLKWMNRIHSAHQATHAVEEARKAGFENLNLDLMYNFPEFTEAELMADIEKITALNPQHISAYSLTIEPKTVFGTLARKGKLQEVEEDMAAGQFLLVRRLLSNLGFQAYEVSNFSKPGFESKHNTQYWFQTPYLGIGPGAYSFDGLNRWTNEPHNARYLKRWNSAQVAEPEKEKLRSSDLANEMILTRMRTMWGLSFLELEAKTGIALYQVKSKELDSLEAEKWIQIAENTIKLTEKGLLLTDSIALKLCL